MQAEPRLDHDLSCAGDGLIVGADGIKLDLNGHTITGSGVEFGISVIGRTGVSIVRCNVRNFVAGERVMNSTAIVVRDNQFISNMEGVDLAAGSVANTINENHFQDNQARGIMLRCATSANLVEENTFS